MTIESNFRDSVKTATVNGSRQTAVTLVVLTLFLAVIFALSTLAIEIARPYLPVHKPGPGGAGADFSVRR